jgi:polyhydroxyalkanoate synthesis regulator phasin
MSNKDAHYPTIMELKTIEFEINLLLKAYDSVHKSFLQNIIDKDWIAALNNLAELERINQGLLTGSTKGNKLLDKALKEGEINHEIITLQKQKLDQIIRQAESQREIAKRRKKELLDIEADVESTDLLQKSNSLEYTILTIVGIIVAGLTVKTITNDDVTMLDNAILAIIVGLIIYYVIKKLY